ncbi:MAG: hypothetical protein KKD39_00725 [Candidatus Altiarchaeota archaeon]|nr:hypothetical protein [Candidatus Altiarchaeota archaeon]
MSKGQLSSIDLVFASLLVVFILLTVYEVWGTTVTKTGSYHQNRKINDMLSSISEALVTTAGNPPNWHELASVNPDNISSIGFAVRQNVLDYKKLDKAAELDYADLKNILGVGGDEISIKVYDLNAANRILYDIGMDGGSTESRISRLAILNQTSVEVVVSLSKNDSRA